MESIELGEQEEEIRNIFLTVRLGDVIKVTPVDPDMPTVHLMLCKGGAKWHEDRYPYRAVNLGNGYLWGMGDTTLEATFSNWFIRGQKLIVADLEIINKSEIMYL